MKAKYIYKAPFRDNKHKFIFGREYDIDQQTLEYFPGRFEVIESPKPKPKKAKAETEEVVDGTAELE